MSEELIRQSFMTSRGAIEPEQQIGRVLWREGRSAGGGQNTLRRGSRKRQHWHSGRFQIAKRRGWLTAGEVQLEWEGDRLWTRVEVDVGGEGTKHLHPRPSPCRLRHLQGWSGRGSRIGRGWPASR